MFELIISSVLVAQSISVFIGSIFVLQRVLNASTVGLRLSFILFPIAASLEILDVFEVGSSHLSAIILNWAILLIMLWIWSQRTMFSKLNELMISTDNNTKYSIVTEIIAIISSIAFWVLHRIKNKEILMVVKDKS